MLPSPPAQRPWRDLRIRSSKLVTGGQWKVLVLVEGMPRALLKQNHQVLPNAIAEAKQGMKAVPAVRPLATQTTILDPWVFDDWNVSYQPSEPNVLAARTV
jgi:hypothetical protein